MNGPNPEALNRFMEEVKRAAHEAGLVPDDGDGEWTVLVNDDSDMISAAENRGYNKAMRDAAEAIDIYCTKARAWRDFWASGFFTSIAAFAAYLWW